MDRVNYEISTQMARILKNTILKTTIDPMLDEANEYDGLERFLIDRTPIPYRKNWRNKKSSTLFKGQLISKCPFGIIVWTKYQRNYFCPEIFCTFLGASWKLFGLPGDLLYNIINKEANKFRWYFVQTIIPKGHFEINWPLARKQNTI